MPKYVAIVGGSCSGKTWLATRLEAQLDGLACRLSLDNFYHDQSKLPLDQREMINFDDPEAIDWRSLEAVVLESRIGEPITVPNYDFATHSRQSTTAWVPKPIVLMDGLWLLHAPKMREAFTFSLYLEAPRGLCEQRRFQRDQVERGRTPESIRQQLDSTVFPMHDRYVAPQASWANVVFRRPPEDSDVEQLANDLKQLISF